MIQNQKLPDMIGKISSIFNLLDIPEKERETLFDDLVRAVLFKAYAETLHEKKDIADKLRDISFPKTNPPDIGNLEKITNELFDDETKKLFEKKVQLNFSTYLEKLMSTVDQEKQGRINELWNGKH